MDRIGVNPLRIAYFLPDGEMAGGVRVAVAHGDALIDRGHEVVVVSPGDPPHWRRCRAEWIRRSDPESFDAADFDFVVGTFWTTIPAAHAAGGARAIHFCQGYEGAITAYRKVVPAIEEVYRLPVPKITVSPHLVEVCRRFFDDATCIGQIVDNEFYQTHTPHDGRPRVLLVGPAQADFKGIDVGYAAVRRARAIGADFDLIRVSQWPAAEGEQTELAAEFHVGLLTDEIAKLIATCDLFLGPSRAAEGFGLPAAEAMASGVPAILSEIPSFRSWDDRHDYALFAAEGDGVSMGDALARALADASLRDHLRRRGSEVTEQFRASRTGERLERYFLERRRHS